MTQPTQPNTQPQPKSVGRALVSAFLYVLAALLMIPLILAGFVGAVYVIIWTVRTFGALGLVGLIVGTTLVVVFCSVYSALRTPPTTTGRRAASSASGNSGERGRGWWMLAGFLLGRDRRS